MQIFHVCIYIYNLFYVYALHIGVETYTHNAAHISMHRTYAYMYIYTYTSIYIYIYISTYTQVYISTQAVRWILSPLLGPNYECSRCRKQLH